MTVWIDTNTLVQVFGRQATHRAILNALLAGQLTLALSNETLFQSASERNFIGSPVTWPDFLPART